jgi:hypothetical protein
MSAYTPGPWYWADNVPDAPPQYRMIADADGFTVCDPSPMSEHDARLIAAAPELLAALRDLLSATEPTFDNRHEINAARDAIAQAIGEDFNP